MPGVHEVREVEYLFLDSISAAKKFIYLEAQYFSSKSISRAIARRLREPNGPEIVMVLARDATGWIEESTMSVLRQRVLDRIRKSDRYNRFRIYHPVVPDLDEGYVKVHSKVTIIDDQFARIGSANLNQRSMGLDTECDVSFEANGDERISQAIGKLRTRLLSEHLGVEELKFEEKFIETKSLIKTVEFFLGGPRTLVEFEREIPAWLDLVVPGREVIDPNRPYRISRFKKYFPNLTANVAGRVHWLGRFKFATLIIILCLLFVAWKWTPLAAWIQPERISVFLDSIRENPMGPLLIILTFIIGGLVMVPVMALTVATGLTFEPLQATVLTLIGSAASALITYWIGGKFESKHLSKITNTWLKRIKTKLAAGGWIAVAVVRMIPVAPFTIVNLVAGSIGVPFRDFAIGTVVGLFPGIIVLIVLADRISDTMRSPNLTNLLWLSLVILMAVAATRLIQYLARRRVAP